MRFIKVAILIFVFSTNLMLGQKNDAPIVKNRCRGKTTDLRILQTTPNFIQTKNVDCFIEEISQTNQFETGAFFQFAAF